MGSYKIALAGNPNVGKSSVFNLLTGLKQHTGNWPGKTVAVAEGRAYSIENSYCITDTPGAYSLMPRSAEEEIAKDCICSCCDAVLLICDACCLRRNMNLALQINASAEKLLICVNLMDEAEKKGIRLDLQELSRRLGRPVIGISAREKSCRGEILDALDKLMAAPAGEHFEANVGAAEKLNREADGIMKGIVSGGEKPESKADRIICGRLTAFPLMLLLLALIFYITIVGANYPSAILSELLFSLEDKLRAGLELLCAPPWLTALLTEGVYRVLAWVVSVMLPPMAIFFPLFTLLEDAGYLPRVAYNLDRPFEKCFACGKQALTMCMGFGCNAAGVVGCRIIDSERERLIAMLTNAFVPCNGRFPMLVAIISMFFALNGSAAPAAVFLTVLVAFSIFMSLMASRFLSKTFLKGLPSAFVLELPPYRKPRIIQVLIRSVLDRTVFVLGRAVAAAAPAGAVLWLMANVKFGTQRLMAAAAGALEPLGQLMGMDGKILLAFILGLPANEIVLPLIVMIYSSGSALTELGGIAEIREILINNGWTVLTALNTLLFSLMHWPCAATLLSIKKESGSLKYTLLSVLIPSLAGFACCTCLTFIARLIH